MICSLQQRVVVMVIALMVPSFSHAMLTDEQTKVVAVASAIGIGIVGTGIYCYRNYTYDGIKHKITGHPLGQLIYEHAEKEIEADKKNENQITQNLIDIAMTKAISDNAQVDAVKQCQIIKKQLYAYKSTLPFITTKRKQAFERIEAMLIEANDLVTNRPGLNKKQKIYNSCKRIQFEEDANVLWKVLLCNILPLLQRLLNRLPDLLAIYKS